MTSETITFQVNGRPPPKSEAKSIFAKGGTYEGRVIALLTAARDEMARSDFPGFGARAVRLEVKVETGPGEPPWDATNYLGGISDVLENKAKRNVAHPGSTAHLAELEQVALYDDDRQIKEILYREQGGAQTRYTITLKALDHRGQDSGLG